MAGIRCKERKQPRNELIIHMGTEFLELLHGFSSNAEGMGSCQGTGCRVHRGCPDLPAEEQNKGLADQLRRATTSAALNIAEGCNRSSNRDFRRFLVIGRTSLDEVSAILDLSFEARYLTREQFDKLTALHAEAARTLYGLIRSIESKVEKGEVARSVRSRREPILKEQD